MPREDSFWYKVGYALERTRQAPASGKRVLDGLRSRNDGGEAPRPTKSGRSLPKPPNPETWPTADALLASGAAALAGKVLNAWQPRGKAGITSLVRAGLAGAAAAFLVELIRPLLEGRVEPPRLDREVGDRLMLGAGQGVVYGAVVEPRIPGPLAVKGALYGSAEYAVDPMGGLSHLLGSHTPLGRLPVVSHLLEDLDRHERAYLDHVAFGMALALLYGSSPSSSGILVEGDEE